MSKPFWIPLIVAFGTMALLYSIGIIANEKLLIIKLSPSYTEISLVPIIIGILIGFITERMIKNRSEKYKY